MDWHDSLYVDASEETGCLRSVCMTLIVSYGGSLEGELALDAL